MVRCDLKRYEYFTGLPANIDVQNYVLHLPYHKKETL